MVTWSFTITQQIFGNTQSKEEAIEVITPGGKFHPFKYFVKRYIVLPREQTQTMTQSSQPRASKSLKRLCLVPQNQLRLVQRATYSKTLIFELVRAATQYPLSTTVARANVPDFASRNPYAA